MTQVLERVLTPADYAKALVEPRMLGVHGIVFEGPSFRAYLVHCRANSWYSAGWWLVLHGPNEGDFRQLQVRSKGRGRQLASEWAATGVSRPERRGLTSL